MPKPRVLIDINVLMDVLQKREPFFDASAQVLTLAEDTQIEGYVSAHAVTTLMYLLAKDKSSSAAKVIITSLLQFLKVIKVDQSTIEQAMNLDCRDFEDAVQMIAALQAGLDYLVTRNPRDFGSSPVPALQPIELIKVIQAS